MPHPAHHLFLSYSRKDNLPQVPGGEGWITAFYRRLQAQHRAYTGHDLKGRLVQGLRTSRLFLVFLSPNYMRSPNCRWEWEEYLRRDDSLARGEDCIRTIYFEIVPGMPGQGSRYSASVAAILILFRLALTQDTPDRGDIIQLLLHLAVGYPSYYLTGDS